MGKDRAGIRLIVAQCRWCRIWRGSGIAKCQVHFKISPHPYSSLSSIANESVLFLYSLADSCLRCQADNKRDVMGRQDCVVVWGECNHSFHHCCMSLWVKQNNRCPLCQQEWSIQRMGK
ncbi:RING-box protein 2 [Drosophila madeirensis]|uniref:RING-box protein 2 n=1 Tax=Drosophila madeirensis TaxID=30013 RepID=A0AAU9GAH5_DROMD